MSAEWFAEYVELLHDPAHWLFEITLQFLLDFLIIFVGYKVVFKRFIAPKLRRDIHAEIDREHHPESHKREDGKNGWQGWE